MNSVLGGFKLETLRLFYLFTSVLSKDRLADSVFELSIKKFLFWFFCTGTVLSRPCIMKNSESNESKVSRNEKVHSFLFLISNNKKTDFWEPLLGLRQYSKSLFFLPSDAKASVLAKSETF